MNKKLIPLLKKKLSAGVMLDCYNQTILKDISCTITTRVSASNNIWVVVRNET